jgi:hypothetical protein
LSFYWSDITARTSASAFRELENSVNTMSPVPDMKWKPGEVVPKPSESEELVLEAWAQGYLVGSLVILSFITLANMRRGVLLHKVSGSLLEQ